MKKIACFIADILILGDIFKDNTTLLFVCKVSKDNLVKCGFVIHLSTRVWEVWLNF